MQGILTTLSQTGGGYKYDYATIPFLAEFFKVKVVVLSVVRCFLDMAFDGVGVVVGCLWVHAMEGGEVGATCNGDNQVERHIAVPGAVPHLPRAQQCAVSHADVCGYLHASDHGKPQDRHNWNSLQVRCCSFPFLL